MSDLSFKLCSFSGKMRTLHLTWFAFFLTFMIWFNHAPLLASMRDAMGLSSQQIKVLLILNVALTIPARIIMGMLVDSFGPRRMYSLLLFISALLCFGFAAADTFEQMAMMRFLMGFVGAGFVIGIRMVSEWFPAKQVGLAEGVYGGWGNFGSAVAAMFLPVLALLFGGENGWRYAIAFTGVLALVYSVIYYRWVRDTPQGATYFKPKKAGAMEVSSKGDFFLYLLMNIPMFAALALLTWKLGPSNHNLLGPVSTAAIYGILALVYAFQVFRIYQVNIKVFTEGVPKINRYKFKQVAILDLAYLVTFGSELAVVSILPLFFMETFGLSVVAAGFWASGFALMNLVSRPGGGRFSDRFGRRKTLILLLIGLSGGYFMMSQINASWPVFLALAAAMLCSVFVQAGSGAVFAMVPLVKRRLTGQVAGMTGAYGNVGAVIFLTVFSFVSPPVFFLIISAAGVSTVVLVHLFLDEPEGHMVEVLPEGKLEMIEVA